MLRLKACTTTQGQIKINSDKLFFKLKKEGAFPKYEASITLIPKPNRHGNKTTGHSATKVLKNKTIATKSLTGAKKIAQLPSLAT